MRQREVRKDSTNLAGSPEPAPLTTPQSTESEQMQGRDRLSIAFDLLTDPDSSMAIRRDCAAALSDLIRETSNPEEMIERVRNILFTEKEGDVLTPLLRTYARRNSAPLLVPTLSYFLPHESAGVRQTAAEFLGELGVAAQSALPILYAQHLRDRDPEVRDTCHESFMRINALQWKKYEEFSRVLASDAPIRSTNPYILSLMLHLDINEGRSTVLNYLQRESSRDKMGSEHRRHFLTGLSYELQNLSALEPAIQKTLIEVFVLVGEEARGMETAILTQVENLGLDTTLLGANYAAWINPHHADEAISRLADATRSSDEESRFQAILRLPELMQDASAPSQARLRDACIERILDADESMRVKYSAIQAIGQVHHVRDSVLPTLETIINNDTFSGELQAAACRALGELHHSHKEKVLGTHWDHPRRGSPEVGDWPVTAQQQAMQILVTGLSSNSGDVRESARRTLETHFAIVEMSRFIEQGLRSKQLPIVLKALQNLTNIHEMGRERESAFTLMGYNPVIAPRLNEGLLTAQRTIRLHSPPELLEANLETFRLAVADRRENGPFSRRLQIEGFLLGAARRFLPSRDTARDTARRESIRRGVPAGQARENETSSN